MSDLAGKRILIVEDEAIIAMTAEDMIEELGCVTVGPASNLTEGLRLASDATIDGALLDINLNGARSFAIADVLTGRGIPYAFATGYGEGFAEAGDAPVLAKPYRFEQVAALLKLLLAGRA